MHIMSFVLYSVGGPNTLYSMLFHLSSFKLLLIFLYIFTLYMFFFSLSPSLSLAQTVFSKPISLFSIFHYSLSLLLFNLNIILFYIANHLTMYTKFSFNILTTLFYLIPAITHISSYNIFIRIRMLILTHTCMHHNINLYAQSVSLSCRFNKKKLNIIFKLIIKW